mgnify:CR=1 FL=1
MPITKEMIIGDVVQKHPNTIAVFRKYGMGCFICAAVGFENIEQGALAHRVDINMLVADLNRAAQEN